MLALSSACLAISLADERGTLQLVERESRFGGSYIAISDERGIIEVADDLPAAEARRDALRARRS